MISWILCGPGRSGPAVGLIIAGLVLGTLCLAGGASAHQGGEPLGGFQSGFVHPIFGYDHLLAMFAVGIWGAQIGGRAVWELPVTFPLIMAGGGLLGMKEVPLPQVEPMIAASMLVLGLAVFAAWKAPEWAAMVLVGAFAIFHGYAHGTELPAAADPLAYGAGFVIATGAIHILGINFGLLFSRPFKGWIARVAGGAIAVAGLYLLLAPYVMPEPPVSDTAFVVPTLLSSG